VGDGTAEDIVAETFLIAWRRLDSVPGHERAWLLAVARKVIANERRREHRRAELAARLAREPETPAGEPRLEPEDAVLTALASLRERDREALRLVYWDGLEPSEAARALGCTAVAMRVRLHRARARLARALAAEGHQSPDDESRRTPLTPT